MSSAKDKLLSELLQQKDTRKNQSNSVHLGHLEWLHQTNKKARTVVLIHPVGGSLFCYNKLVSRMTAEWNILGIEGLTPPHGTSPDLHDRASDYSEQILDMDINPDLLMGWSVGGLIAWEMARHFANVPILLIDSTWPQTFDDEPSEDELRQWFQSDLLGATTNVRDTDLDEDPGTLEHYFQVFSSNASAFCRHQPSVQYTPAALIAGFDTDPHVWRSRGKGNPEIFVRNEGHYELLRSDSTLELIRETASSLQGGLDNEH